MCDSQEAPVLERILRKLELGPMFEGTPCWMFTGAKVTGYGTIGLGGRDSKNTLTHIYMHDLYNGLPPEGWERDHLCRNRACCNPKHLEAVPHKVNCQRGETALLCDQKALCKEGHELTPENTRIRLRKRGTREKICLTCHRLENKLWAREKRSSVIGPVTHCKHGHEFTEENTYLHVKNGGTHRLCVQCRKDAAKVQAANRKAARHASK